MRPILGAVNRGLRILAGILALGLFVGGIVAFADLQSNERVTLLAVRQACAAAGAGAGPVMIQIDGRDPTPSLVSDAAAAGLTLIPLAVQPANVPVRLIVSAVRSTGMFTSTVSIRRLGEGTDPGKEIDYHLAWSLGWTVERP